MTTFRFLPESSFLTSELTGAIGDSAPGHPPANIEITALPRLEWRSADRQRILLNQVLPARTDIYGVGLINVNAAPIVHIQNAHEIAVAPDPLTGLGVGFLLLAAPEAQNIVEIEFPANTPTLDGADYYRAGAIMLFGSSPPEITRPPNRPAEDEWETDEEENPEERQRLLPPVIVQSWEATPQTDADLTHWQNLIYRRDLREPVLFHLPNGSVFLARLTDHELEDRVRDRGRWRMRWQLL